jgi:hypothetical protein
VQQRFNSLKLLKLERERERERERDGEVKTFVVVFLGDLSS